MVGTVFVVLERNLECFKSIGYTIRRVEGNHFLKFHPFTSLLLVSFYKSIQLKYKIGVRTVRKIFFPLGIPANTRIVSFP